MKATEGIHLPFENLKFCATSVSMEIKKEIIEKITLMGGSFSNHLMEDTNILIVGLTDTEKYRYCAQKRFNIRYLSPGSIFMIYEEWMDIRKKLSRIVPEKNSESITKFPDLDKFEVLPFEGMVICLSRLSKSPNKLYRKDHVIPLIERNGGKVTDSLTISNTAVITLERSGKRYDKAREWNIPTLHPKWILDCAVRGAVLEFKYYDIYKLGDENEESIGRDAFMYWSAYENKRNQIYSLDEPVSREVILKDISNGLFKEQKFYTYGFSDSQVSKLTEVIQNNGGIVTKVRSKCDFFLVSSSVEYQSISDELRQFAEFNGIKIVTEWFIERSLFYNCLKFDSWSKPRRHTRLSLNHKISISGFSGIELLHIQKIIEMTGCKLCDSFNEDCDLLVVNLSTVNITRENRPVLFDYEYDDILDISIPEGYSKKSTIEKINASKKWNIPIVSLAFLWEMTEIGDFPSLLEFKWCLFGPQRLEKRKDVSSYSRSVSNGMKKFEETFLEEGEILDNENSAQIIPANDSNSQKESIGAKLPSPKKSKSKKWPRIVGTASESQLPSSTTLLNADKTKRNLTTRLNYENAVMASEAEENVSSQISYNLELVPRSSKRIKQYGRRG